MPSKADAIDAALKARGAATLKVSYAAALAVAPTLPQQRQRFFASHVVTQFAIWYHTAAALGNMSTVITAVQENDYAGATLQSNARPGSASVFGSCTSPGARLTALSLGGSTPTCPGTVVSRWMITHEP